MDHPFPQFDPYRNVSHFRSVSSVLINGQTQVLQLSGPPLGMEFPSGCDWSARALWQKRMGKGPGSNTGGGCKESKRRCISAAPFPLS